MSSEGAAGGAASASGGEPELAEARSYGSGARILSIGLALTGLVTFAFFSLAAHALPKAQYQGVSLLWTLVFLVCSVIYRPIEQLLARTLAESRGHGRQGSHGLPIVVALEAGAGVVSVGLALAFRSWIETNIFPGEPTLYWIFVAAIAAYSVSYFARGWLAGSGRPELYGALVFIESSARCLFPIVVLLGLTSGTLAVAFGIAAAPLISLAVVPIALRGGISGRASSVGAVSAAEQAEEVAIVAAETEALEPQGLPGETIPEDARSGDDAVRDGLTLRSGAVFAGSVVLVMAAEQTLITAGVMKEGINVAALTATAGAAAAIFNAFLVARAPLQLFQAIQSTLLPHLAELRTSGDAAAAAKAAIASSVVRSAFAGTVTLGLLLLGPWAMSLLFPIGWDYTAVSLALVGVGMGFHLAGGTLNQSALAHGRAPLAAIVWALAAALFVVWLISGPVEEPVLSAASGYAIAAGCLFAGLLVVEARSLSSRAAA